MRKLKSLITRSLGGAEAADGLASHQAGPSRVRVVGDQLHDPRTECGERDTLDRQPGQAQQTRRIIATVNHGPRLSSRCS